MSDRPPAAATLTSPRLIGWSLVVGVLAGAAVTAFRLAMGGLGAWRNAVGLAPGAWWEWLILPLIGLVGGAIAGWLAIKVAPDAGGGGILDVDRSLRDGGRGPRLRFRAVAAKFAGGVIGIGGGLSLGREGPSIHIGAGLGDAVDRLGGFDAREPLILAGVAGGMAAAFNTPLAAIVFVVEGLRRDAGSAALAPVAASAVAGDAVARMAVGHVVPFAFAPLEPAPAALPAYLLLGLACGVLGHVYKRALVLARAASLGAAPRVPRAWHPAIVGLLTGVVGIGLPDTMGGGLNLIIASLYAGLTPATVPLVFGAKLVATAAAYGSGAPGGYIGPALVLGAIAGVGGGQALAALAPGLGLEPATFAQAGMGAIVAAALHVPLTATLLTIELTGRLDALLPVMAAVVSAYLVALRIEPRSLTALLAADPADAGYSSDQR